MKEEKYILSYSKIVLNQYTWSEITKETEEFDDLLEAIVKRNLYFDFIEQQDRNLDSNPVQIEIGQKELDHWEGNEFSCIWSVGKITKRILETVE